MRVHTLVEGSIPHMTWLTPAGSRGLWGPGPHHNAPPSLPQLGGVIQTRHELGSAGSTAEAVQLYCSQHICAGGRRRTSAVTSDPHQLGNLLANWLGGVMVAHQIPNLRVEGSIPSQVILSA